MYALYFKDFGGDDLITALGDESENVRLAAIEALRALKYPSALPALSGLLKDANSTMRYRVVSAIRDIVQPIIGNINDSEPHVFVALATALVDTELLNDEHRDSDSCTGSDVTVQVQFRNRRSREQRI